MDPIMEKRIMHVLIFSLIFLSAGHMVEGRGSWEGKETDYRQLGASKKPAITTLKTDYGDAFDCVDIYKQPAFAHTLLKNHKLKLRLSSITGEEIQEDDISDDNDIMLSRFGLNGTGCPFGTVPIHRTSREELLATRDQHSGEPVNSTYAAGKLPHINSLFASVLAGKAGKLTGANARINVWSLRLQPHYWSAIGMFVRASKDWIGAGWMVNPSLFGDSLSRLFVMSTASTKDGFDTGCINYQCPIFIQIHPKLGLGISFPHSSQKNGPQYEFKITIYRDPRYGDWWLLMDKIQVGYWPMETLPNLHKYATFIGWGGVTRSPPWGSYAPSMGSGRYGRHGFRQACYIRQMQFKDENRGNRVLDVPANTYESGQPRPNCYEIFDAGFNKTHNFRRTIYVGGPGCRI